MSAFDFAAWLLVIASAFGFINYRYLRLPSTVGVLVMALGFSLALIALDMILGYGLRAQSRQLLASIDLPHTLLDGSLAFLLFAGGMHVNLRELWSRKWAVLALATLGVLIATALFAAGIFAVFGWLGADVPFLWCLVLGAILAPTDPIAVAGLLKRVGLPASLQATVAGESLFNDGVGVVVFLLTLGLATGVDPTLRPFNIATGFFVEAVGGAVLGTVTGYVTYLLMRRIDDYHLELMISLALATATYSLAAALQMSGPIAVVMAGLLIGNHATRYAMSDMTREHITTFWALIDELLNVLLFLLIGFEILAVEFDSVNLVAAAAAIPLALVVRLLSVVIPTSFLNIRSANKLGGIAVLTWGGLRGGISVALALSLPATPFRGELLTVCYAVVVFTVVVQGLTMPWIIRRFYGEPPAPALPL
jgi:CPA1 family monovalent cation:H+ antiporter